MVKYPIGFLGILRNLVLITGLAGFQVFMGVPALSAGASTWDEIQERGFLTIAVKDNWYPLGFRDQAQQLQGFEIDLARRLAQELLGDASAVQLIPVRNLDRISAVTGGKVDFAIAGISITTPRARLVDFSPAYYQSGIGVITKNPKIQRLGDLHQKSIAVLEGSVAIPHLKSELPSSRLLGVASYQQALERLEAGQADAFAGELTVLQDWRKNNPQYRQIPGWLSAHSFAVALPKGIQYDQLRQSVEIAIRDLKKQGWLQQRARFWGLPK